MYERFTDRARAVLVAAQQEAQVSKHLAITEAHILLGCSVDAEAVSAQVLHSFGVTEEFLRLGLENLGLPRARFSAAEAVASVGVDLFKVKEAVESTFGEGTFKMPGDAVPFAPTGKTTLELSLRAALALHHNYIGTEHLLLALTRLADGNQVQQLLRSAGTDVKAVEQRALTAVSRYRTIAEQPNRVRVARLRRAVAVIPPAARADVAQAVDAALEGRLHLPLAISEEAFDEWLATSEEDLGTRIEALADVFDRLGVAAFLDVAGSLLERPAYRDLTAAIKHVRDAMEQRRRAESTDEAAVAALSAAVRADGAAKDALDEFWRDVWDRHRTAEVDELVARLDQTVSFVRSLAAEPPAA